MTLFNVLRDVLFPRVSITGSILTAALTMAGVAHGEQGMVYGATDRQTEAYRKHLTLLGIPSAPAVPGGFVFASVSATANERFALDGSNTAGALGVGLDVGEAFDLQLTTHFTSLFNDFIGSGYFSAKASRRVDTGGLPVYFGVSVDQIASWGNVAWRQPAVSAAVTAFPTVDIGDGTYPLMLTLGAGTDVGAFFDTPGVFAGAGIGLSETFAASVAWNHDDMDIGISYRPEDADNWWATAAVNEVFDTSGFDRRRVTVTVNWISDKLF